MTDVGDFKTGRDGSPHKVVAAFYISSDIPISEFARRVTDDGDREEPIRLTLYDKSARDGNVFANWKPEKVRVVPFYIQGIFRNIRDRSYVSYILHFNLEEEHAVALGLEAKTYPAMAWYGEPELDATSTSNHILILEP